MSSLANALVTYEEFLRLPEAEDGHRYELHDGEVVLVPPARPVHLSLQMRIQELLRFVEEFDMFADKEFPYKPGPNFQFWYADVAVIPRSIQRKMPSWEDYRLYAPPLVVEVLSPSNRKTKVARQRLASMSHGTREFWVVDPDQVLIQVTTLSGFHELRSGDRIEVLEIGKFIKISGVFDGIVPPANG